MNAHELFVFDESLADSIRDILERIHGELNMTGSAAVNDLLVTIAEMDENELAELCAGRTDYTIAATPDAALDFLEEWLDILARQFTFPRYALREMENLWNDAESDPRLAHAWDV